MGSDRITDIVITTRNRFDLLQRTVEHIIRRTRSPYRLHVIDDGSDEPNAEYLMELWYEREIETLLLCNERRGAMANLNAGFWMSFSDPMVFTDDDVLCPDVEPDWLARGLAALDARPTLGLLALNHPGAHRRVERVDGEVTICKYVGGTFMFVRRRILQKRHYAHFRGNFGATPTMERCNWCRAEGLEVGYLTETYCQHIGVDESAIYPGERYKGRDIPPLDPLTLEPPEAWRR